jgi:hypothetical protein
MRQRRLASKQRSTGSRAVNRSAWVYIMTNAPLGASLYRSTRATLRRTGDDRRLVLNGGVYWWKSSEVTSCANRFPIFYGQQIEGPPFIYGDGASSVEAKPLRIGVVYEVSTSGDGAYGSGWFRINKGGRVENLTGDPTPAVVNEQGYDVTDYLAGVFDKLRGRGALNEQDVREAMREVRVALLEADVALPVVRRLHRPVTERRSARKCCARSLPARGRQDRQRRAGRDARRGRVRAARARRQPPAVMMMVGLQGSGKTTTTAKLAKLLRRKARQEGADGVARRRPPGRAGAARGARASRSSVATLPIVAGQQPVEIARRALQARGCRLTTCCCSTPPGGSMSTSS